MHGAALQVMLGWHCTDVMHRISRKSDPQSKQTVVKVTIGRKYVPEQNL